MLHLPPQHYHVELLYKFRKVSGHMYVVPILQDGDSHEGGYRSRIALYEDGVELRKKGEHHDNIRLIGRGRYSHWGREVFFSTTDNSDPNTNGRRYTYTVDPGSRKNMVDSRGFVELSPPFQLAADLCWSVAIADEGEAHGSSKISTLSLWEDDKPLPLGRQLHDDIRRYGAGRYSHWGKFLLFSTSDGTDPNTNGRSYSYVIGSPQEGGQPKDQQSG